MRGVIRNETRILSEEDTLALLCEAEHGVLATINQKGQPCTTALNHVYVNGFIYFHSGPEGEKLENIRANPEVSYFVTGVAEVLYDQFTTAFSSAVVNGRMQVVADPEEKLMALRALVGRYSSEIIPKDVVRDFIANGVDCIEMLRLTPEHITGKARLTRKRPCLVYEALEIPT